MSAKPSLLDAAEPPFGVPRLKVLVIGAFERHNFGDILFFLTTRAWLDSIAEVVPASIIDAADLSLLGEPIFSIQHHLSSGVTWDAIWTAGGEVGGVSIADALAMSLPGPFGELYRDATQGSKELLSEYFTGLPATAPAYLLSVDQLNKLSGVPTFANSVGLSFTLAAQDPQVPINFENSLRLYSHVSVRDAFSRRYLEQLSVSPERVTLAPDVVHTLPLLHEKIPMEKILPGEPYFLFQANTEWLAKQDREDLSHKLLRISDAVGARPLFFTAGSAPHHDSIELYQLLGAQMQRDSGGSVNAETTRNQDAVALASVITHAKLWIGTSLHGRIIASAFGVPRVSLTNAKVQQYAETWDSEFPYGISISTLVEAATSAVANHQVEPRLDLATAARDNLNKMIGRIPHARTA